MLFATTLVHAKTFHRYTVDVTNAYHPPAETAGLYVVDFQVTSRESGNYRLYSYRVYCPTNNVRDISGSEWGSARIAEEEDRLNFKNYPIMQEVVEDVCQGDAADRRYRSKLPE